MQAKKKAAISKICKKNIQNLRINLREEIPCPFNVTLAYCQKDLPKDYLTVLGRGQQTFSV